MKPTTYCQIKRQIQLESVKNKTIRAAILLNNVQKQAQGELPARVELVYDFCVKVCLIGASVPN